MQENDIAHIIFSLSCSLSRFLPSKLIDLRTGGVLVKYKTDAGM